MRRAARLAPLVLLVLPAIAGCGGDQPASMPAPGAAGVPPEVAASANAPALHRSELINPKPAPDFTLTDQHQASHTLSDGAGRVRLIGFVYSH